MEMFSMTAAEADEFKDMTGGVNESSVVSSTADTMQMFRDILAKHPEYKIEEASDSGGGGRGDSAYNNKDGDGSNSGNGSVNSTAAASSSGWVYDPLPPSVSSSSSYKPAPPSYDWTEGAGRGWDSILYPPTAPRPFSTEPPSTPTSSSSSTSTSATRDKSPVQMFPVPFSTMPYLPPGTEAFIEGRLVLLDSKGKRIPTTHMSQQLQTPPAMFYSMRQWPCIVIYGDVPHFESTSQNERPRGVQHRQDDGLLGRVAERHAGAQHHDRHDHLQQLWSRRGRCDHDQRPPRLPTLPDACHAARGQERHPRSGRLVDRLAA